MRLVKTEDAVGQVLCHDMTQIIPGIKKGPVFPKGHIVTKEDIPVLLSIGKEHLYVWELADEEAGLVHENEAALILRDICMGGSASLTASEPSEGKIEIRAAADGLFKVDGKRMKRLNSLGDLMIATIHGNFPVKRGDKLAGTRIIPLVIERERMEEAKRKAGKVPLFSILPFHHTKVTIITTGNEVALGRIQDGFGPVLKEKLSEYDTEVVSQRILPDDREQIKEAVLKAAYEGTELILVTGGMSVDPDDKTPGAIKDTGAEIVSYGAPVLPGAMFLLSYLSVNGKRSDGKEHRIPVLGLPGCIMYARRTIFDLILPRVLAGEELTAEDINVYGEGGLCLNCEVCHFPHCAFGKVSGV